MEISGIKPVTPKDSPLVAQSGAESCGCGPAPASKNVCCGPEPPGEMDYISVAEGEVATPVESVPRIGTSLNRADRLGGFKARWGVRRMQYAVEPGLYAVGAPDANAPVLVSANYKMSLDRLREQLGGRDAWILVLDTRGINVWCAAGKGTFGTEELVARIEQTRLTEVVSHRRLIVPQLGAPGVAGWRVKERTGFGVKFGPVEAADLPAYLDAGLKATPEMRRKRFPLNERLVLIPLELAYAAKPALLAAAALFFASGLGGPAGYWENLWARGPFAALAFGSAVLAGSVLSPLLLPWIRLRSFSAKGALVGLITALAVLSAAGPQIDNWSTGAEWIAWLLLIPALSSFLAMNFTGASTFTSLSGVKKEMRYAVPVQIGAALAGLVLWITARIGA